MIRRVRFSFSLRSLFAAVAVCSVVAGLLVHYWNAERRFADAKHRYDGVVAKCDAGLGLMMEVCAESYHLYVADCNRWFRSKQALSDHVDRLRALEELARAKTFVGVWSEDGHAKACQIADDIRVLRECAEKGDD